MINESLIPETTVKVIKEIRTHWAYFEFDREESKLSTSKDREYALIILQIPFILKFFIDWDDYHYYKKELNEFIQQKDYTYEELDNFICNLDPIYKMSK